MKAVNLILSLSVMLAASGCATSYQANGFSGGYSETRFAPDIFRVVFNGNGYTSAERAQDFALLRAAELAVQAGFSCFAIIDERNSSNMATITTPGHATTTSYGNGYSSGSIYPQRTELNVRDSDGTVIFTISEFLSGGSKKTATFAAKHKKPFLHISRSTPSPAQELRRFLQEHEIRVLNVAGTRASKEQDVAEFVIEVLSEVFGK